MVEGGDCGLGGFRFNMSYSLNALKAGLCGGFYTREYYAGYEGGY